MKFTNVDVTNQPHLQKAIQDMKDDERENWQLLMVYDKHVDLDKLKRECASNMKNCQKNHALS